MARLRSLRDCERQRPAKGGKRIPPAFDALGEEQGASVVEFAIVLPLLVVFVVGIYDFSGAFNQKQKIEQAAQEGAILAGAQPMSDLVPSTSSSTSPATNPASLQAVLFAIVNSLSASGVLTASCATPFAPSGQVGMAWTYAIGGCSAAYPSENLVITINRGCLCAAGPSCTAVPPCASGPPVSIGTVVTVSYPYHWQFNSVIQTLIPGAKYAAITQLTESATVHNQM